MISVCAFCGYEDLTLAVQTRTILVSTAIVALALCAVGILIGHFGIKKPDREPASDYLYVGCDNSQLRNIKTGKLTSRIWA